MADAMALLALLFVVGSQGQISMAKQEIRLNKNVTKKQLKQAMELSLGPITEQQYKQELANLEKPVKGKNLLFGLAIHDYVHRNARKHRAAVDVTAIAVQEGWIIQAFLSSVVYHTMKVYAHDIISLTRWIAHLLRTTRKAIQAAKNPDKASTYAAPFVFNGVCLCARVSTNGEGKTVVTITVDGEHDIYGAQIRFLEFLQTGGSRVRHRKQALRRSNKALQGDTGGRRVGHKRKTLGRSKEAFQVDDVEIIVRSIQMLNLAEPKEADLARHFLRQLDGMGPKARAALPFLLELTEVGGEAHGSSTPLDLWQQARQILVKIEPSLPER
jgi:hypothetical protein